jgi:hypothetical protein
MTRSDVHEILAQLYLRLNGYFTTGLILHSPDWGNARTEIDCLAVRHPHHSQSDRCVETAEFLGTYGGDTEIILCEVKSELGSLAFNRPVREDPQALRAALQWAGLLTEEEVDVAVKRFQPLLQSEVSLDVAKAGIIEGSCRIRGLLCCPPCSEGNVERWCLLGSEIFRFAGLCFNPSTPRESCSTRYNFQQWGYPFTPVVRYLKNGDPKAELTLEGLYAHLGIA